MAYPKEMLPEKAKQFAHDAHDSIGQNNMINKYDPNEFFRKIFILWCCGAILSLSVCAALIFVAWHFISKFW